MKRILALYQPYMARSIFYKCVTKSSVALTAILLWNRYINRRGLLVAFRDGGLFVAVCLLAMAWFSYLSLDNMKIHHLLEERKKKPVVRSYTDMVDFVDEHITTDEEMEPEERTACRLASSVISGLIFLIPAIILTLLT